MLSAQQLQAATGCTSAKADLFLKPLNDAMATMAIDTPKRMAAFLAQIAHESGRFVYVREIWGPTPAQTRYEGRADLGNTQPGDGKRYVGRGLIQITGRSNYQLCTAGMRSYTAGVPDFEASPEQLEQPTWAALSAAWFWRAKGLNPLADADQFELITRRINGGLNGLADRKMLWDRAKTAMGVQP